jgi:hypothetical protein
MDQQFLDLYHTHVGMGFDRRLRFKESLDRKAPRVKGEFDVATGQLKFGPRLVFESPIIGTHAEHNNSWHWAGANRNLKLTLTNRALSDTVRALGARLMVPAFAGTAFPLEPHIGEELAGHATDVFGTILVEELEYDAYHAVPFEGGRALLLIRDDRLQFVERHPVARVLAVFPQVIKSLPVPDHRAALTSYARAYGLNLADVSGGVKVSGPDGDVTAAFDDRSRLLRMEGNVKAPPKPTPKPAGPKVKPGLAKTAKAGAKKKPMPALKAKPTKSAAKAKPTKAAAKTRARPAKAVAKSMKAKPVKAAKSKAKPAKKTAARGKR